MLGPREDDTIRRASAACAGVDPEAEMPDRPPPGLTWNVTLAWPAPRLVLPGVCRRSAAAMCARHVACDAPELPARPSGAP